MFPVSRPRWLGARVLPRRSDGFGKVLSTPRALRDRRLPTIDLLPPPSDGRFRATTERVPPDVLARSTWRPSCPVAPGDLRYATVAFWGFDRRPHTGELIVSASVTRSVVRVFHALYRARFPIEEMRVVSSSDLHAPPTGDGNNTTAFVCRRTTAGVSWSQHAYGLAVDLNPFHNPYVSGNLVVPERASAYANRGWKRPGMIFPDDVVTRSFGAIGWGWGGEWQTREDWMHFSQSGG
jgi:D-alanyl-D-alanine carboxypeptidase